MSRTPADSTRRTEGLEGRPRAVLLGVQLPEVSDAELASSLDELARLATTLGLEPIARVTQRRDRLSAAAVVGEGKLKELARWTGGRGAVPTPGPPGTHGGKKRLEREDGDDERAEDADDGLPQDERATVVLVDHELSPRQARNLERAVGAEVVDRSSLILRIFQRHARTREAKLQIEIARLSYDAPRLRESPGGRDRQRGGIGGKGAGESALELDRRRIRDRIAELRKELAGISAEDAVRRARRRERGDTVALVGYTNAGKSSWFRRLTASDGYVADELFATLDTTVRRLQPEPKPPVLVSDTVGFIKKLPHDLVASFRSTLEEAREASLLLQVVDASDAAWREQLDVTREVLEEIGLALRPLVGEGAPEGLRRDEGERPCLLVLNKADLLDDATRAAVREERPEAVLLSARDDADLGALRERIAGFFEADLEEAELFVPWARHALVARLHEEARVLEEVHGEDGTTVRVRATRPVLGRVRGELDAG
ncbi:MAG: GTPase HflX [Myxococcota bacterium]